jgi:hypothetical protein
MADLGESGFNNPEYSLDPGWFNDEFSQEKMEAWPRIELGCTDLQSLH